MEVPKSYKGLKNTFNALDEDVQGFLSKLGPLLDDGRNFEIALAYFFMKLEEGHHRALKCGLVRLHDCHSQTVDLELEKQHFTAAKYANVFKNVFGESIPKGAADSQKNAQRVRNKLIHGKTTRDPERRKAIFFCTAVHDGNGRFCP